MDWGWIGSNAGLIWERVLEHVALSAPPIVIGFLISIPLGYWASRSRVARSVLLVVGNIVYTIPSLALIVLVPVVLGLPLLTPVNVIVALTLYALALMVRTAADAFASVPRDVASSATSIGFSPIQRFFSVELPLAGPVLLASVRVVSVSTVSLVSVGAVIGVDNLGSFFTDAFQRSFPTEAIVGIVTVLIVAAVFDVVLNLLGRALMPWRRGAPRAAERPSWLRTPTAGGLA
jgi:osmoprotectant transport system permease protein